MGMIVFLYRSVDGKDCTNGGASSRDIKGFTITNIEGPFEPSEDYPSAEIRSKLVGGQRYYNIKPNDQYKHGEPVDSNKWCMFGGNYCTTSDSRFPHDYPLPVHDRIED
jgi:hypothetical protein